MSSPSSNERNVFVPSVCNLNVIIYQQTALLIINIFKVRVNVNASQMVYHMFSMWHHALFTGFAVPGNNTKICYSRRVLAFMVSHNLE